jgi:hypothetical protein
MAAPKQEVVLSPVLLKIETKFEMFFGGFGRGPTQRKTQRLRHVTADAIFQHGGSQTALEQIQRIFLEDVIQVLPSTIN